MKLNTKKIAAIISAAAVAGTFVSVLALNASGTYSASITSVPSDIVSATVSYCDMEWATGSTDAKVTVSNGSAVVENLSDSGYYTVKFCTKEAEVGMASFFLGNSGKVYAYEYAYDEALDEYKPTYTETSAVEYEENEYGRLLDISGDGKVELFEIPSEAETAIIYVDTGDYFYGEIEQKIDVNEDGTLTLSGFGTAGDYLIDFYNGDNSSLGSVSFYMDENCVTSIMTYEYNSETKQWEEVYVPVDTFNFMEYAEGDIGSTGEEGVESYTVTIQNVPDTAAKAEVQCVNAEMESVASYASVSLPGDGTAVAEGMSSGYYTFNFYDADYNCIGYTTFYLDSEGVTYTYDAASVVDTLVYNELESAPEYEYGDMSVEIYDVPEEIDFVEARYYYGEEEDETILFEPEISSVYTTPLTISGLGMTGSYKLNFYVDGEIRGNAEFYLDADGKVYIPYFEYNDSTQQWEETLVEAETLYYYVNNDILSADNYSYGSTKLTLTNVPADVQYAEVIDYEADESFTAGLPIFPDVTIGDNGVVTINNFGEEGYYEIDLLKEDGVTKAGYVFICIDSDMNIYHLEYNINPDTFQVETARTQTSVITLTEYTSSTVDYVSGDLEVTVYDAPVIANRILVTCNAADGTYAYFEDYVQVASDGTAVLSGLGMEGDYTVTFMSDKTYLGTASFYLSDDGSIYDAVYVKNDDGSISAELNTLSKVVFEADDSVITYDVGDFDFSGSISISDIIALQKYLLNIKPLTASQYNAADLNGDGRINIMDMTLLKRIVKEK